MFRKIIVLVLSVFLLLTSLVSCSNKALPLDGKKAVSDDEKQVTGDEQKDDEQNGDASNEKSDDKQNVDNSQTKKKFSLNDISKYRSESGRYDLRSQDLSSFSEFDLTALNSFVINSDTKLPDDYLSDFEKIINYGKNPGLDIRKLHKEEITGKGVNIAIIDGVLLKEHNEIKDRIVYYEDLVDNEKAHYHGTIVTSIAYGKESGIAPEANVYYVSYINDDLMGDDKNEERFESLAKSIERVVEINKDLPEGEKIRVVSISSGWYEGSVKAVDINNAINKAKEAGIFVVTARSYEHDNFYFDIAKRDILSDPDDINSYYSNFYSPEVFDASDEILFVPSDARWLASHTGVDDYIMYSRGAWSMVVAYISGVYTLACQVYPEITPEQFCELAISTGSELKKYESGFEGKTLKLINPTKIIEELKALKDKQN